MTGPQFATHLKGHEIPDIVENTFSLLDSRKNRGEIIFRQYHVRGFL